MQPDKFSLQGRGANDPERPAKLLRPVAGDPGGESLQLPTGLGRGMAPAGSLIPQTPWALGSLSPFLFTLSGPHGAPN